MSKFMLDFNKSNKEITQEVDIILEQIRQELPQAHGNIRNDYEKIIEALTKIKKLLENDERIPALSIAYDLTFSLEN